jgi:hypothetical protein
MAPPKKPNRKTASARRLSRRRFMALIAAGVLAASRPARAITSRSAPPKPKSSGRSTKIEKGIAEQKDGLAKQLHTLRDFPLAMGSDPAFVFRPVSPRRMR